MAELEITKMSSKGQMVILKFVRRTEEAWKKYGCGEFKSLPVGDFLKELEKWIH